MTHFPSDPHKFGAANRDPEEEALGWIVRFHSGDATEADRTRFDRWARDADNAAAYRGAERLWNDLGPALKDMGDEAPPVPLRIKGADRPRAAPARPRRRLPSLRHLAAAAVLLLSAGAIGQYVHVWQYDIVSAAGGIRQVRLADGSRMVVAPDSALNTDFAGGRRHVVLARGEAYFDVRPDPSRPFVVSTPEGMVRVLGTAFAVRRDEDARVTVTVTHGRVEVTSGAHSTLLLPDQRVSFDASGLGPSRRVNAALATLWTRGRLAIERRPLRDVLDELNRYRPGTIVLLNDEAGRRRVNAVIDLDRSENWLSALALSQGLRRTDMGPITVLR